MSHIRVLRISIPEHIGIDEHEARLTLKQAAELAGLRLEDFMKEISRRKVSIINLDEEELEEELRAAEDLAGETKR